MEEYNITRPVGSTGGRVGATVGALVAGGCVGAAVGAVVTGGCVGATVGALVAGGCVGAAVGACGPHALGNRDRIKVPTNRIAKRFMVSFSFLFLNLGLREEALENPY